MKLAAKFSVVLVTAPDLKVARRLVRLALREKLVACGNIIPKVESHYWWQGKVESSAEILIVFKTASARLAALEKCVLANHPYHTPEIIALPLLAGHSRYLDWISASAR